MIARMVVWGDKGSENAALIASTGGIAKAKTDGTSDGWTSDGWAWAAPPGGPRA